MKLKKYLLVLLPLMAFVLVGCGGIFNGDEEVQEEILLGDPAVEEFAPDDMWVEPDPAFEEVPLVEEGMEVEMEEEDMMEPEPEMME